MTKEQTAIERLYKHLRENSYYNEEYEPIIQLINSALEEAEGEAAMYFMMYPSNLRGDEIKEYKEKKLADWQKSRKRL